MRIAQSTKNEFNRIKNVCNFILALFITTTPLITVLIHLLGGTTQIHELYQVFALLYLVFTPIIILSICFERDFWRNILTKLKRFPVIITIALFGWITLSSMVNNSFNVFLLYFVMYLCIVVSVLLLNDKQEKIIVNTLIFTLATCCFLGLLDPGNKFMPGFDIGHYSLSLMFYNPNYAGYAMAMIAIVNTWIMITTEHKLQKIFSIIAYFLFAIYLFMNGSFAPIVGLFFTLIVMIVYLWIKEKKCPTKLLISTLGIIPFIFLIDLIPNINDYRHCDYNFFLECIAVLDNILGTKMLRMFGISEIVGADGWDRDSLQSAALAECLGSAKTFLFGNGAGGNFQFIPHNTFLCLWLNFGILPTLLYYTLNIYLLVRFFKLKNNRKALPYAFSVMGYIIILLTGDLIEYSFVYHMIIFGVAWRKINECEEAQKKAEQEAKIAQYLAEHPEEANKIQKKTKRKSSSSNTKTSSIKKTTTKKPTPFPKPLSQSKEGESFEENKVEVIIDESE